mgnify:FL=1
MGKLGLLDSLSSIHVLEIELVIFLWKGFDIAHSLDPDSVTFDDYK